MEIFFHTRPSPRHSLHDDEYVAAHEDNSKPLLKAIRQALRGTGTDPVGQVHVTRFAGLDAPRVSEPSSEDEEYELSWDSKKVVLSCGGVIRRKWDFAVEQEPVQYACVGWLDRSGNLIRGAPGSAAETVRRSAGNLLGTEDDHAFTRTKTGNERPTFGPFTRQHATKDHLRTNSTHASDPGPDLRVRVVFVFLRMTAHVIPISRPKLNADVYSSLPPTIWDSLTDSFTFALPFIVRSAFPLHPHGVLVQRVLEQSELDEAKDSGEEVLPTLFSITRPFSEIGSVGVTEGVVKDTSGHLRLVDEDEIRDGVLKAVPSTEQVIWVSSSALQPTNHTLSFNTDLVITMNAEKKMLTIWRYAYLPLMEKGITKDSPTSANIPKKKRQSIGKLAHTGGHARVPSSGVFSDMVARADPLEEGPFTRQLGTTEPSVSNKPAGEATALPKVPLRALPSMAPALTAAATMESLMTGMGVSSLESDGQFVSKSKKKWLAHQEEWAAQRERNRLVGGEKVGRRESTSRNELSVTMDRMALGGKGDRGPDDRHEEDWEAPDEDRMNTNYWMEKLFEQPILEADILNWREVSAAIYDHRFDGQLERACLAICFPSEKVARMYQIQVGPAPQIDSQQTQPRDSQEAREVLPGAMKITWTANHPAISVAAIRATRKDVLDLLFVLPDGTTALFAHGTKCLLKLSLVGYPNAPVTADKAVGGQPPSTLPVSKIKDVVHSSAVLSLADGSEIRCCFDLIPRDSLTLRCFNVLSVILPPDPMADLHRLFITFWRGSPGSSGGSTSQSKDEFMCLTWALYAALGLPELNAEVVNADLAARRKPWEWLAMKSPSNARFSEDPVFRYLRRPSVPNKLQTMSTVGQRPFIIPPRSYPWLPPVLYALHLLAEDMRLVATGYADVLRLCPVICRIASIIRPEWIDFWARLCPTVVPVSELRVELEGPAAQYFDDRIATWPPDASAILFGRLTDPDWAVPMCDPRHVVRELLMETPSYALGAIEPMEHLPHLSEVYRRMADRRVGSIQKRGESVVDYMVANGMVSPDGHGGWLEKLSLGIAAPIFEATRTCQMAPPANWSAAAYNAIGRNDLAARVGAIPDLHLNDGYASMKDYSNPAPRSTITELALSARSLAGGEIDTVSGVELGLEDFTSIRFGQDRRLDEVARMLCSSTVPNVRFPERPDLNEHDQAREQQNLVVRIAERTLALPYGRAMFTFGSVSMVTQEAYSIPKLEYNIRLQPLNIIVAPEATKIPQECMNWGEFHNGVAAALRISSSARRIESSWIAFNKPSELTPEHAGFLLGLGLTGHLREMLTWHTFSYLTPKHDLTSIGVLLGLAAANVGTGNHHVMKLLAVHTPALLPNPMVDLNVPLVTQAAGLAGVGLLCMGTKNRRMAEVCLGQISRKDLIQPDLTNEHREAYTYSSALAFGMIMLGKGSNVPADAAILTRLSVLIHGETDFEMGPNGRPSFDINLTSPAATIALGLMYLRTERRDVAEILTIPQTVLELNRIQPSFLLMRTLARTLIMWDSIAPTTEWLVSQVPPPIAKAMEQRFAGNQIDDALELAYYNLLAACCFAIGLKYAGTARQEAYLMIISYFDLFSRLVHVAGPAFDHKIKRSAIRDGLNIISIALSMVMAGTGEITCLRRLRYAYGMYHQAFKYGIHIATHMSIGLLFLGGGRFTLGTSDASIACMIAAFFPRTHQVSNDNKSYLQALRHLWVLAVEPRCLVARDVDTSEVVYLPVKITMKDGAEETTTQLISPTLIPDLDKLSAIRVDTPRYWPFYLDVEHIPKHRESLLKCQTLYVKRKTAFLSYTEDPRGSRSLFVRSGSSSGDAFILDFPQITHTKRHPANDLSEFITSSSNDHRFLAYADHFSRSLDPVDGDEDSTEIEKIFQMYCHASLLDCILQDKPRILQGHLTLWQYRMMKPTSKYFHMRLADLRFCADFYSRLFTRRFGGSRAGSLSADGDSTKSGRAPLIRESTVGGALLALDRTLDDAQKAEGFKEAFRCYANGLSLETDTSLRVGEDEATSRQYLAWYLLRHCVPASAVLFVLKDLARNAHTLCVDMARNDPSVLLTGVSSAGTGFAVPGPFVEEQTTGDAGDDVMAVLRNGADVGADVLDVRTLDLAIKAILHNTGTKMSVVFGTGWSASSLDDVITAWNQS